ncbi:TdeIII family type II restriction endonuclease [Candidatus Roizmanbacteria bacterium CG_4_9_14_3_um_filter_33_18]|uniref:type II site-specific deoxyribonuclease n=1 Tax=Candidatus Roizmanbacteria bacterium CG_4_9_14_3_um_filter_33_18 TaxID=1974841 RepID=A0A2M7XXT2_9BACT|nr:MAG: TdeIII family type II restriction endonuclease [Candidatus Roizmanbacteria bacterium CG_4_9_14_3_um_filter_33_18]
MINNKNHIVETIKNCLRDKFLHYLPETQNMPFHYRLLGKDRMALFSFIQSLNTTFGTSIYEPVAKELAKPNFKTVETQFKLGSIITETAQKEIQKILNNLSMGKDVDKLDEIERIRKVSQAGKENNLKSVNVDLFLVSKNNEVFMFDLKTVKPNITDFTSYKRNLLQWLAIYFYQNPKAIIHTLISIPYNPYEPKPYARWTMKGMLDLKNELMIAGEFWDFLGGKNTYIDLLDCFEKAGIELRPDIDKYFSRFK